MVVAALCGCLKPFAVTHDLPIGPVVSAGTSASPVASAGTSAGPVASAGTSVGAPQPSLPGGTSRGGLVQRGQVYDGVLARNESHDFQVDLRAEESIHFQVTVATEIGPAGERCQEWGWSWRSPDDGRRWRLGNPGPLENGDRWMDPRTIDLDLGTGVPIADQMPGRWTLRIGAGEGCYRIRYRIAVR